MSIENIGLQKIVLDISKKLTQKTFYANEVDTNGRGFHAFLKNNGVTVDGTGVTLRFRYTSLNDGQAKTFDFEHLGEHTNGEFEFHYPTEMVRGFGGKLFPCTIVANDANGEIAFENIFVYVNKAEVPTEGVEATNEFSSLGIALGKVDLLETTYAPRLGVVETGLAQIPNQTYITNKALQADLTTANNTIAQIPNQSYITDKAKLTDISKSDANLRQTQNSPINYSGAVLTFVDDDCQSAIKTTWQTIINAKSVKVSFACLTDLVGTAGYMTKQELLDLQTAGHDILSHGRTSIDISAQAEWKVENEFSVAQQYLRDNGFNGYDHLVYSGGLAKTNYFVKNIARKYYKYGVSAWLNGDPMYNSMPVDNWCIFRVKGDTLDLATLKAALDSAIANNGWVVVMTHSHLIDATVQQKLSDLIDYANGLSVPILPFTEAVKYKGNAVATGEFYDSDSTFIGVNGKSKVGLNMGVIVNSNASTNVMDALISTYKKEYLTVVLLDSAKDTLTASGGVMHVFRSTNSDVYSYAIFYPYNTNLVYKRMWRNATSVWWGWELIAGNIVKTTAQRNALSPVTAGLMVFDSTLNKPIWRNTANTGWVDATGATV